MRIFVAGATGVLGRRVVKLLAADGHDVSAVARSPEKAELVEKLGARAVAVDLFDAAAVAAAVAGHDVVMNLATHIPPTTKMSMARSWRENDRIRTEVSRSLVDAAVAAGAKRYIQESIAFYYAPHEWADETTPVELPKHALSTADAEAQAARFTASGGIGIALRFGMFYCPDSDQTQLQVKMARRGIAPFFGAKDEYQSVIHLDDAASAVVAALKAPAGVYNIVDDEPLTEGESADVLARAVGRKRLRAAPRAAIAASGSVTRSLLGSQRVSNKKFKDATDWRPKYPSAREGLPALVRALS
jgi:nucleoside-diphosphate-sugar epimerase